VGISIPTDSDFVRKAFEPRAPSIGRRLRAAAALREAGVRVEASVAPLLPCTPPRLAARLAGRVDSAWVGTIRWHGDEGGARAVYRDRGWERYLAPAHKESVRAALQEAGMLRGRDNSSDFAIESVQ